MPELMRMWVVGFEVVGKPEEGWTPDINLTYAGPKGQQDAMELCDTLNSQQDGDEEAQVLRYSVRQFREEEAAAVPAGESVQDQARTAEPPADPDTEESETEHGETDESDK